MTQALTRWHLLPAAAYENFRSLPNSVQELAYGQETQAAGLHLAGSRPTSGDIRHLAFALHLERTGRLNGEFVIRKDAA